MHVCCVITAESITAAWVQLHLLSAASKSLRPTPSFFLPPLLSLVFFVPVSGNGHNMLVALCQVLKFCIRENILSRCYVAELSVFEGNDLITHCLSSLLTTISHYLAVFYNRISGNTKFKRMK